MKINRTTIFAVLLAGHALGGSLVAAAEGAARQSSPAKPTVNLQEYDPNGAIRIAEMEDSLAVRWSSAPEEQALVRLSLTDASNLIRLIQIGSRGNQPTVVARNASVNFDLSVGQRNLSKNGWTVFFDSVDRGPVKQRRLTLEMTNVRVSSNRTRATVKYGPLGCDGFRGELWLTFFEGSPLIHVEAVIGTEMDARAITYMAALSLKSSAANSIRYHQAGGGMTEAPIESLPQRPSQKLLKKKKLRGSPLLYGRPEHGYLMAKNRSVAVETQNGSLAVFPSPHKFFYPLDYADNFGFNFAWQNGNALEIGFKQSPHGDGRYRPWINAPPHTRQHLDLFLLVSGSASLDALKQVKRLTHDDRYPPLPGHQRFTTHYHLRHTRNLINLREEKGIEGIPAEMREPSFMRKFKETGIDIAHLAEFHGGPKAKRSRLEELKVLHEECERLSDENFLLIPGEEPNVHLGGHWISFFPKPVYWELRRKPEQPFMQQVEGYGTVYRVGSAADVQNMMERENGLVWVAHPRIKGSTGFPDLYRDSEFFRSETFLGAAWKAMPADFSRERLGERVLNLLDDMNQWGDRKYILGEADLFELNAASEFYGHMNINYLKLDELPKFANGWQSVRDALRQGRYFTSTGETLIPQVRYNSQETFDAIEIGTDNQIVVEADLQWTFPLQFAEIVTSDGREIFRDRIDLSETRAFGRTTLRKILPAANRKWIRIEVWDIAENGAFTQPVGIESRRR